MQLLHYHHLPNTSAYVISAYLISGERSANRPKQLRNDAFHVKTSQSKKKLARSCKKWKSAKIRYTPYLHEGLQLSNECNDITVAVLIHRSDQIYKLVIPDNIPESSIFCFQMFKLICSGACHLMDCSIMFLRINISPIDPLPSWNLACSHLNFAPISHYRNMRGLGKSMVVFRLFEKLRYSNERATIF